MNEQFSRLYHLAWNYSEFDNEYQEKPTYERRCVVQSRIFAELIVRECIQNIRDNMEYAKVDTDGDKELFLETLRTSGHFYITELKAHFGVSE